MSRQKAPTRIARAIQDIAKTEDGADLSYQFVHRFVVANMQIANGKRIEEAAAEIWLKLKPTLKPTLNIAHQSD